MWISNFKECYNSPKVVVDCQLSRGERRRQISQSAFDIFHILLNVISWQGKKELTGYYDDVVVHDSAYLGC